MFQKAPCNHTCISRIITDKESELRAKLDVQPFDEIYDDDVLNNKYDELNYLNEKLQKALCKYPKGHYIVQNLTRPKQILETQIEELLLQRAIKYADWKKEVMRLSDMKIQLSNQIKELEHIDASIDNLMKKRTKLDVMSITMFHNMINTLLSVSGYQKENTPNNAFAIAFNKGLIDNRVYKKLVSRYK
jgi:hypothetical protein